MRIAVGILIGLFALSPLPIGSNWHWAWLLISGVLFLLMATWCVLYLLGKARIPGLLFTAPSRLSIGLFFACVIWILLQSLPLPISESAQFQAPTAALYKQAMAASPNLKTGAAPISIDAGITAEAGLKSAGYLCLYVLLLLMIDSRSRLKTLCYVIVLSGMFQAVFGSFMTLSGVEYLLGVKKHTYLGFATGTFVNRNHFAGYLEMALSTGIGLMMVVRKNSGKESSSRWRGRIRSTLSLLLSGKSVLRLTLIVMVTGLILSRSRMGNAAFFNSLLITGFVAACASASFRKPRIFVLLASILLIDIFLLGSWFGLEKVVERIEQTTLVNEGRDEVVQNALPMLQKYGLTGSGAGTFYYLFPAYADQNLMSGYDHAHNDYLEILSDLGIVGFTALAGLVLISLWQGIKALRHSKSSFIRGMGFAGFMGTLSLLIHSGVDFNLQIPANAMLFVTLLAIPGIALSLDGKSRAEK